MTIVGHDDNAAPPCGCWKHRAGSRLRSERFPRANHGDICRCEDCGHYWQIEHDFAEGRLIRSLNDQEARKRLGTPTTSERLVPIIEWALCPVVAAVFIWMMR